MLKELILYADESVKSGEFYSNFYGGCLIRSEDIETVKEALNSKTEELHLNSELKWQKVTSQYLDKYFELMNLFFDFVQDDVIKVRIMFMQNNVEAVGIEEYHKEHEYFLLYYQFIKHAFGLGYIPSQDDPIRLRIYFDRLPDTKEKAALFKSHITSLSKAPEFRRVGLIINEDQVAEINSKKHILLQCTDIILGAMQFRLNNLHKVKPEGSYRRGKRTIAKEKLYKFINKKIREVYPNFNIGISTGLQGDIKNRWEHPYRHWSFVPSNHKRDDSKTKRNAP